MSVLSFLWESVKAGGSLWAAPFKNFNMLWIIIPVYLGWFFAEFYQEKRGTSLGNAISNGTVALWVGADWARTTFTLLKTGEISLNTYFFGKLLLAAFMVIYGLLIIIEGIETKGTVKFIGRIRVVTYFIVMMTPIFYDAVPNGDYIKAFVGIAIFFPIFYYFIELVDIITPDNEAIREESGENKAPLKEDYSVPAQPQQPLNYYQQPAQPPPQYPPQQQYPQYPPQFRQPPPQQPPYFQERRPPNFGSFGGMDNF
jgi:hypothetical protein